MNSTLQIRNGLFYALLVSTMGIALSFLKPISRVGMPLTFSITMISAVLGLLLVVFSIKAMDTKKTRALFIVNGASILGIPVFAVMHNLVYALLISVFGRDFWGEGGDEPFFFILALIICPLVYLTTTALSIFSLASRRLDPKLD